MDEVIREKDKGVSAIVGTILIVAITVVLAATVYGVLTGFGGLIGNTAPTASMSVSSNGYVYTVSFNSVSSSNVKLTDLNLKMTYASNGTVVTSGPLNVAKPIAAGFTIAYSNTTTGTTLTVSTVITITASASLSGISLIDSNPSGTVATWSS